MISFKLIFISYESTFVQSYLGNSYHNKVHCELLCIEDSKYIPSHQQKNSTRYAKCV
jgi:hypothetical protein